jgi:outer membrane protein assembly factor BamD (BamD/ComL family)
MAGGQNQGAEKLLEQGSAPGSPNAGMALYELGRLRQQRLGDAVGALEAFRRYRNEFPDGPLRSEVAISILQLALAQKDSAGALEESTAFLAANPRSERADEVRLVRGNLLRERGECGPALESYRQVQNPLYSEDALYFTALCQQQLGEHDSVQLSLRDYLRRFPGGRYVEQAQRALGSPR